VVVVVAAAVVVGRGQRAEGRHCIAGNLACRFATFQATLLLLEAPSQAPGPTH
jgi:hypothetical protein